MATQPPSSMPAFTKETLERLTSILEGAAYFFTFIGAMAGVGYLIANRPLKRMIETETVRAKQESDEKIASLTVDAEKAKAEIAKATEGAAQASAKAEGFRLDIAKANESAKQAEARAAEANLELARFKAPRTISLQQQGTIVANLRPLGPKRVDMIIIGDG